MADVGVVGAGIVGLATGWALRERGAQVTLYERGVPGNAQSGGRARIFRHAHDDVRLVRAAVAGRARYAAWSDRFGIPLVSRGGTVALGPAIHERCALLRQVGVPARLIDGDELARRLPLLAAHSGPALLDEAGGAIDTRAAVTALHDALADALAADEVLAVRPVGDDGAEVRAGGVTTRHDRLVVCAGQGTAALARAVGLALPVRTTASVRLMFRRIDAAAGAPACLQDATGDFGEVGVYGTPVPGSADYAVGIGGKHGTHAAGGLLDPGAPAQLAERIVAYVRRALPGLDPEPIAQRHCWVTDLPWGDDGLAVWEAGAVLFLAGHNLFKHAPWLGEQLAGAALDGRVPPDLRPDAQLGRPPPTAPATR